MDSPGENMSRFEKKAEQSGADLEEIPISREQAAHGRLKAQSPRGEDVIIELPRGEPVHDGDTFGPSELGRYFKIKILAEQVMQVTLKEDARTAGNALMLGYGLGGHHLEVLVEGDSAFLPLNISSEKLQRILDQTGLPLTTRLLNRVIDPGSSGYFAGEDEGD
jgi:urease accessory protein UreE